jgi:hypothetical protein
MLQSLKHKALTISNLKLSIPHVQYLFFEIHTKYPSFFN